VDCSVSLPTDIRPESFLERLRGGLLQQGGLSKQFLIEHQAEYPTRIRAAITKAKEQQEENFMEAVRSAVRQLFLGRKIEDSPGFFDRSNQNWLGLDSSIDKESEVEAVIHCFPWVLNEELHYGRFWEQRSLRPIEMLLSRKEALKFIPLLAKFDTELTSDSLQDCIFQWLLFPHAGSYSQRYGRDFVSPIFEGDANTLSHIVDNRVVKQEFSDEALSTVKRLIEQGHTYDGVWPTVAAEEIWSLLRTDCPRVKLEPRLRMMANCISSIVDGVQKTHGYCEGRALGEGMFKIFLDLGPE